MGAGPVERFPRGFQFHVVSERLLRFLNYWPQQIAVSLGVRPGVVVPSRSHADSGAHNVYRHISNGAGQVNLRFEAGQRLVEILLGRTQFSTTMRYAHLDNDPLRRASESIAGRIAAALDGKSSDVVAIKTLRSWRKA